MGDRGHIVVHDNTKEASVVLYTHWMANNLPEILATALSHEERWTDNEYLARIIFDEISTRCRDFTGCGIGTEIHGDVWRVIDVYPNKDQITFRDGVGFDHHSDKHANEMYSFEEYIEEFGK